MKPQEINPQETTRAEAFELWMNSPNPMVTFFKKIDVTNLVHISRKYKWKFNMLLCWCIGRAAGEVKEFYMLPVYCKIELPKVANGNWRMLHLQIGESCKAFARSAQERCSA